MSSSSNDRVIRADNGQHDERANALRALAMDAVQQANSGHPGAPMGMAEMAVALWSDHLRHNPAHPHWPDRDRFVLSNGHASMLIYALLHLTGYDLPIDELRRFRQLHSKTPGHPEVGLTPGVETTTGPLGQGITNAVGMALAEKLLGDEFNRPGHRVVDHHSYVFLGDGCLMEGISHEACALAGAWKLNKLIALYDDNGISIDGAVQGWFVDDTPARFRAYGWNVIGPIDGHDVAAVSRAVAQAKASSDKPTLIDCRTTIGRGSPSRAGTAKAHGEPLGVDEIRHTREAIGWTAPAFEIPASVAARWNAREQGAAREAQWQARFAAYRAEHPALAAEFERRMSGTLPADFDATCAAVMAECGGSTESIASRKASQKLLALLAPKVPELLGGSADLTGSNLTDFPGCGAVRGGEKGGRHINYGVREFGMAAIMNGIALHGGFIPYGGTFPDLQRLQPQRHPHGRADEAAGDPRVHPRFDRPGRRRAHAPAGGACGQPALDSQPRCLAPVRRGGDRGRVDARAAPGRPADRLAAVATEPAGAAAPGGPVVQRSAWRLCAERSCRAVAVILATGSEVGLAMAAQQLLDARQLPVRVVSLPSSTVFDCQDRSYRDAVLGRGLPRIGIEAGVTRWWGQYGCSAALGLDQFGESAPAPQVYQHIGLTAERLAQVVEDEVAEARRGQAPRA